MSEDQNLPVPTEVERAPRPNFLTDVRFDDFDLDEKLLAGLKDAGFEYCTPIQARVLPISLTGKDIAGQAQTGTGKTAAFLVTIFNRLLNLSKRKKDIPAALIVAPTRELARQIYEEALLIGKHLDFRMMQVVGGIDYQKQADELRKGVDIVVCTPGRIIDYYKQKVFKAEGISILVIDEADRLLDLGFAKDMQYLLSKLPSYKVRQSLLLSATLSYRVMELTYEYMNLPEFVAVTPEEITVEGIEQVLYHVGSESKFSLLLGVLEKEDWSRVLIFVNTKSGVEWVTRKLKGNQWPAEGITGDLPQAKRFRLMEQFKSGKIKILVATDVASRGIHVEDISLVINYDLPQDPENYVHRIGRTARAGSRGKAVSLACETYVFHLEPLEKLLGYQIPVAWPEDDWFIEDRSGPVHIDRGRKKTDKTRSRRRARKRKPAATSRPPRAKVPPREPGAFPGSFFGFGPPAEATAEKAEKSAKPKKKRTRRKSRPKKKSDAADAEQSAATQA